MTTFAGALLAATILIGAGTPAPVALPPKAAPAGTVCKFVVASTPGAKPYEMCLTPQQWAAKKKADAKDPNRIVCRYEEASATRFKSHKICMTAAEWENQRQLERQGIDAIQRSTCVPGAGC